MKLRRTFAIIAMLLVVLMGGYKKRNDDPGIRPTVTSTEPANITAGVALHHTMVATFCEPMNESSITTSTFTLKQGTTAVTGQVSYIGSTATSVVII